jgi:hypothetical protein
VSIYLSYSKIIALEKYTRNARQIHLDQLSMCRKSDPDIVVVQSAEDRQRENAPDGLDGSR